MREILILPKAYIKIAVAENHGTHLSLQRFVRLAMVKFDGIAPFSGGWLRRLRRSRNMKQMHLAELVGVRQGTISKWERGEAFPCPRKQGLLVSVFSARFDPTNDAWLKRLVEDSKRQVHVMCDSEHRLLAASRPRIAEWRREFNDVAAQPLSRQLPEDIALAEFWIVKHETGIFHPSPFVVRTCGRTGGPYIIEPALMLWERLQLSDGNWIRLVTNITENEIPDSAIIVN